MSIANWNPDLTVPPGTSKASLDGYLTTPWAGGVASAPPAPPSGMVLWLDGQDPVNGFQVSGGNITTWADKSGNGHTVSASGTMTVQSVDGFLWANTAVPAQFLVVPVISAFIAAGYAVFAVVIPTSVPVTNSVFYGTTSGVPGVDVLGIGVFTDGKLRLAAGSTLGAGAAETASAVPLNAIGIMSGRASPSGAAMWVKATGQAETTAAGVASTGSTLVTDTRVGNYAESGGLNFFLGYIGEILIYSPMPSDAQITAIRAYLAAKYGVTA